MDLPSKSSAPNKETGNPAKSVNKYSELSGFLKKHRLPVGIAVGLLLIFIIVLLTSLKNKPNNNIPAVLPPKDKTTSPTDNLLKTACANAASDYPEWSKADTDLVIWENPDKSFSLRNSPEDASTIISTPVPPSETLLDMDFVGLKEISFVTTNNNGWKIGIFKTDPTGKSFIYEKTEPASIVNVSPVNKNEYIALVVNENKGALRLINTDSQKEEIILEIPSLNTNNLKLAVSPKGTYFYLLAEDSLSVFDISLNKQVQKIDTVASAVWVGNDYLLYSNPEGSFLYQPDTGKQDKLEAPGPVANLAFHPQDNGIIAFNEDENIKIVDCQTWLPINTEQGSELKTLASHKTAITKKGVQYGYWRFKDAHWSVKILEEGSKFVTVWQRY